MNFKLEFSPQNVHNKPLLWLHLASRSPFSQRTVFHSLISWGIWFITPQVIKVLAIIPRGPWKLENQHLHVQALVCDWNQVMVSGTETQVHFRYHYWSQKFFIWNGNLLFYLVFCFFRGYTFLNMLLTTFVLFWSWSMGNLFTFNHT